MVAKKVRSDNGYYNSGEDHTTSYVLIMELSEPSPSKQKELLAHGVLNVNGQ